MARRLGIGATAVVAAVGVVYAGVIGAWLVLSGTPLEPIADPYLLWMEVLTIVSAFGIVGLVVAVHALSANERRILSIAALVSGSAASVTTIALHAVQLSAVRQLWRVGRVSDYRLVWPSELLAVEYLAWDVIVGLTMIFVAGALRGGVIRRAGERMLLGGGVLCLIGFAGPLTGFMAVQNVAIVGYGIFLPVGAVLLNRDLRRSSPEDPNRVGGSPYRTRVNR